MLLVGSTRFELVTSWMSTKRSNQLSYGLSHDTKFDLSNVVELPFSERWFAVPPGAPHGQIPKLGLLHPTMMRKAAVAHRAAAKK